MVSMYPNPPACRAVLAHLLLAADPTVDNAHYADAKGWSQSHVVQTCLLLMLHDHFHLIEDFVILEVMIIDVWKEKGYVVGLMQWVYIGRNGDGRCVYAI